MHSAENKSHCVMLHSVCPSCILYFGIVFAIAFCVHIRRLSFVVCAPSWPRPLLCLWTTKNFRLFPYFRFCFVRFRSFERKLRATSKKKKTIRWTVKCVNARNLIELQLPPLSYENGSIQRNTQYNNNDFVSWTTWSSKWCILMDYKTDPIYVHHSSPYYCRLVIIIVPFVYIQQTARTAQTLFSKQMTISPLCMRNVYVWSTDDCKQTADLSRALLRSSSSAQDKSRQLCSLKKAKWNEAKRATVFWHWHWHQLCIERPRASPRDVRKLHHFWWLDGDKRKGEWRSMYHSSHTFAPPCKHQFIHIVAHIDVLPVLGHYSLVHLELYRSMGALCNSRSYQFVERIDFAILLFCAPSSTDTVSHSAIHPTWHRLLDVYIRIKMGLDGIANDGTHKTFPVFSSISLSSHVNFRTDSRKIQFLPFLPLSLFLMHPHPNERVPMMRKICTLYASTTISRTNRTESTPTK